MSASTVLLVVGILSILGFLFASLSGGAWRGLAGLQRWVVLTDGIGFVFWSRAFASDTTQPTLFAIGSVFLMLGVYLAWRSIITRVRSKRSG